MSACPDTNPLGGTVNRSVNLQLHQFKHITDVYVLPAEMIVGFIVQLISLKVLYGKKISGLAYTFYLKALSVTYLMNILILIPAILRKSGQVNQSRYWVMFYHAHLEKYLVNVFIFSGNLIIVALGVEPLRAIWRPLQSFVGSRMHGRVCIAVLYVVATITLMPITVSNTVGTDSITGQYCIELTKSKIVKEFCIICPAILECGIALTVLVVYCMLFVKHICIGHNPALDGINSRRSNAGRRRRRLYKTTSMCLGSITGFLVANSPSAALVLVYLSASIDEKVNVRTKAVVPIWQLVANICLISNFTVTFIMQCLFSAQYRTQVSLLFGCSSEIANSVSTFIHADYTTSGREANRRHRRLESSASEGSRKPSAVNITNGISVPTRAGMLSVPVGHPYGSCSSLLSPKYTIVNSCGG